MDASGLSSSLAAAHPNAKAKLRPILNVTAVAAFAGLLFGIVARFFASPQSPLWLDENFSGAVATAPGLPTYFRLMGEDVNGPLYYLLLRPWVEMFGDSDAGLRSLSLLLSAAAPVILALRPVRGLSRDQHLTWAAMVALWIPAIGYAQAAKPLALAFFLSAVQFLAYLDLMRQTRPSLRSAAIWVGLSALAIEAHYDVAYIPLVQGIIYLAVRRRDAVRTWPAVLLLLPVALEIGRKLAMLDRFTSPGGTWYALLRPSDLPAIAAYALGGVAWLALYPALFLAFAFLGRNSPSSKAQELSEDEWALVWASLASALALMAFISVGAVRPAFSIRYLGPFAPGLLLGVVFALGRLAKSESRVAYPFLVGAAAIFTGIWLGIGAPRPDSGFDPLSIERPASDLMRSGVGEVAFTLDNPMAHGMTDQAGRAIGGFFFRRAHFRMEVVNVDVGGGQDPNVRLLRAAAPHGAAILWMYDKSIKGTGAVLHPPRIGQLDPHYACRSYGTASAGAVACVDIRYSRQLGP